MMGAWRESFSKGRKEKSNVKGREEKRMITLRKVEKRRTERWG